VFAVFLYKPSLAICQKRSTLRYSRLIIRLIYTHMITTIVTILLILWLLGLVTSFTVGGLIHVLLVIAIIMILVRVINGQKPL